MANTSLPLFCRLLLIAALGLLWQACYAAQPGYRPNYQPVIELGPDDYDPAALSEAPASEDVGRNVFLSMLSRAQTANQLAALHSGLKPGQATMGDADVNRLGAVSSRTSADGDGIVVLLLIAILVWFFSFRR